MDKTIGNIAEAVSEIGDGATIMIGGFGGSGAPIELIHALIDKGPKNLTVINNNAGNGRIGIAAMIDADPVLTMVRPTKLSIMKVNMARRPAIGVRMATSVGSLRAGFDTSCRKPESISREPRSITSGMTTSKGASADEFPPAREAI